MAPFRGPPDDGSSRYLTSSTSTGTVEDDARPPGRTKGLVRELVETILLAVVIFVLVRAFVMNYRVIGHSMLPTIEEGQYLLIDKIPYRYLQPKRGDIVVLRPPDIPDQIFIKRVIGLPGETVEVRAGQVFINGQAIDESWETRPAPISNWGPGIVGPDEVFVMGDNRPGSRDSRYFGMLHQSHVIGRAFLCYWPPDDWTIYPRYSPMTVHAGE